MRLIAKTLIATATTMNNYKDKTAMVVSHGLFISIAERLARDFGKVYTWMPGREISYPRMAQGMMGHGLNMERVDDVFGPHFNEIDIFIFPDIGFSSLQVYLESVGKRVWGGRNGEELEIYREVCKNLMQEVGLPVQPWKVIKGVQALRDHLIANEDQHVKIDRWRGEFETFFSQNYDLVKPKIDEIANNLGGFQEIAEFIVEDDLPDCVEVGLDCYCIDGNFPSKTLCGIEVKDLGYVAEFKDWDAIPGPIREWNEKMAPYLARYGYRGFLSTEVRIGEDHKPYMIDACCRAGSPPSELYQEFYKNFTDIIWEGAGGVLIDPEPIAKYGVQVILKSNWAENHWQPIDVPAKYADNVKLFNKVVLDGKTYIVPQDEEMREIGSVVAWGNTLQEAIDMADEIGSSLSGYGIKWSMGPIDSAKKEMEALVEMGISPFSPDFK